MKARFDIWKREREEATDLGCLKVRRSDNPPAAMIFKPKATKPYANYRFRTVERREAYIEEQVKAFKDWAIEKQRRKLDRMGTPESLAQVKPGTIFIWSWGYEQTNLDFYQVVARKGHMLTLREIGQCTVPESTYSHGMADMRVATPNQFLTEKKPFVKKVQFSGGIPYISKSFGWCSIWDGKPHYCSWYA